MGLHGGAKYLRSQQCDSLQEHFRPDQPQLIPMEKSQGASFFVLNHAIFFFFLPAKKLDRVLLLHSILFHPSENKGPAKAQACCTVLSPLGPHEDSVLRNPLPILSTSISFSWDWPPAEPDCSPLSKPVSPFLSAPICCQGQNKSKGKEKILLNLKLKTTEDRRQIALPVTKANPEI